MLCHTALCKHGRVHQHRHGGMEPHLRPQRGCAAIGKRVAAKLRLVLMLMGGKGDF